MDTQLIISNPVLDIYVILSGCKMKGVHLFRKAWISVFYIFRKIKIPCRASIVKLKMYKGIA